MDVIKKELHNRRKKLMRVVQDKKGALSNATEGSLRISCRKNGRVCYYKRNSKEEVCGKYISKRDFITAKNLAQEDYNQKIVKAAEKELEAINKYLVLYPQVNIEQVYEKMHAERQKLIEPIEETKEQFINRWESAVYEGKPFLLNDVVHYTAKGESVRSKSEMMIADALGREGIPYRYECPVSLKGYGTIFPDFTVLNVYSRKEIIWEHFGRMDDPEYVEKAIRKIALYEKNGFHLGENSYLLLKRKIYH